MASETSSEIINWQYLWEYDAATGTYTLCKYKSNPNLIEGYSTTEQVEQKIADATRIDDRTDSVSTRPVQNKTLKAYIDKKIADISVTHSDTTNDYKFNVITKDENDSVLDTKTYTISIPIDKTITGMVFKEEADASGVDQYYIEATRSDGQSFRVPLDLLDNSFVRKTTTINGQSLATDITLKISDLENDKQYITTDCIQAGSNITITKIGDTNVITIAADTYSKDVIDTKLAAEANQRVEKDSTLKNDIDSLAAQLDSKLIDYTFQVPLYVDQDNRTVSVDSYDKATVDNTFTEVYNKINKLLTDNVYGAGSIIISKDTTNHTITISCDTYSITQINELIAQEVEDRIKADEEIRQSIMNEASNRIQTDNDLNDLLNNEIATRKAEDDNIRADVKQKVEYAIQYALNVTSQLNAEVEVRKANDNELQKQITNETTNRTNQDNLINQTIQNSYNTLNAKIDAIAGTMVHTEVVEVKPTNPVNNTMYYVGKDGNYQIWLYSNDTWYDMGTTQIDLTSYQTKTQAKKEHDELEAKITASQGDITTITTDVSNLQSSYTTLSNTVSQHTADIATNAANITNNKNNIATNATNIANNGAAIETLKTQVAQNKPVAGDLINIATSDSGSVISLDGTSEEWTFTLSDNTTVKRRIRYF